ncbi:MAG: lipase [Clostridia bacterium]|nr:lipase [Clostridia bacterium]
MNYSKWVNGWGLGVTHPPLTEAQWTKDTTVRYVLINTLDAGAVRLKFSNRFGENPAELTEVTVAISSDSKCGVVSDTITNVTFGGNKSITIAPHGEVVSDDIPFNIKNGEKLAVSIYFGEFTQMNTGFTYENIYMTRRFIEGNQTHSDNFDLYKMSFAASYNFLWSVDFLTYPDSYSVAAFGDSITSQEWVDIIAQKLILEGNGKRAIVRRAVSGSRIFGSYPALSYFHYGEDGETRFEREVNHDGVEKVIILHGINDIIHPDGKNPMRPMSNMPTAEKLANGIRGYLSSAKKLGYKTYLGTLLPIKNWRTYDIPRDNIRIAFNDWIRTQNETDGFIDFEKAVRDSNDPRAFDPACNRGDNLHASVEGYRRMAEAVDMSIFE